MATRGAVVKVDAVRAASVGAWVIVFVSVNTTTASAAKSATYAVTAGREHNPLGTRFTLGSGLGVLE